jgi:ribonuclease D
MAPLPTSVQVPVVASPTKLSTEVKSVQAQRVVPIQPGKTSYELINKEERAIAAVQELSTADIVAVDMEGINLGRNGKLCLIQITARSKKLPQAPIYLFSVLECPAVVEILRPLLESDTTVKILHDSRQDTAALNSYGINLSPVKDTQRIFDMLHILKRVSKADPSWRDKTLYSGVGAIGLNTFLGAMNQPQNVLKTEMKKCHDKWDQVPLPAKMLEYAASDVIHLIDAYSVMDTVRDAPRERQFC